MVTDVVDGGGQGTGVECVGGVGLQGWVFG